MEKQHVFYAFLATMGTLILVVGIAAFLAYNGKYAEALGVGGVLTGLIGIAAAMGRGSTQANPQADANLATALDKIKPQTTGTGPAEPLPEHDTQ